MIKCHLREGLLPYTHINWSLHFQIFNAVIAPLSTADNKLMFNRSQILGSRILFFGQWAGLDSFCFNSYSEWMNSYLNIFPCFSISRLEMLPMLLEAKLWKKMVEGGK